MREPAQPPRKHFCLVLPGAADAALHVCLALEDSRSTWVWGCWGRCAGPSQGPAFVFAVFVVICTVCIAPWRLCTRYRTLAPLSMWVWVSLGPCVCVRGCLHSVPVHSVFTVCTYCTLAPVHSVYVRIAPWRLGCLLQAVRAYTVFRPQRSLYTPRVPAMPLPSPA